MKEFNVDVWEVRNSMVRTHALVIISVRPWLKMQGLSLGVGGSGFRVSKVGKLQDKGKLGKFHVHVYSGNVHASDCGSAHCSGCVSMAFLLIQQVELNIDKYEVHWCCLSLKVINTAFEQVPH